MVGLRWWELDFGWWVLIGLQRLGIVWDVKVPDQKTIKGLAANLH